MQGVGRRWEVGYINDGTREVLMFSCVKRDVQVRLSKLEFKFIAEILETETTFTFDVNTRISHRSSEKKLPSSRIVEKYRSEVKFSDRKSVTNTERQNQTKENETFCNVPPPGDAHSEMEPLELVMYFKLEGLKKNNVASLRHFLLSSSRFFSNPVNQLCSALPRLSAQCLS